MNLDPKKTSFGNPSSLRRFDRLLESVVTGLHLLGKGGASQFPFRFASVATGPTATMKSVQQLIHAGLLVTAVLVVGLGGWSVLATINGAVIAHGTVVVQKNTKRVQHKEGGIVRQIAVEDGDYVKAGDLLLRLDDTIPRANLDMVQRQIDQDDAEEARLEAERDSASSVTFPRGLSDRAKDLEVAAIMQGELAIFAARQNARRGQEAQLNEQIVQLGKEAEGLTEQHAAKTREIKSIGKQLLSLSNLAAQNYISATPVYTLEQDKARVEAEGGAIETQLAHTRGQIGETKLQLLQVRSDFLATVVDDLNKTIADRSQLIERKLAAVDELNRVRIVAPQAGYVHQLEVHTIGGVVNPGETLLYIVPDKDVLAVDMQVSPNDIDQVHKSQPVILRFTSFNQRTSPEINGVVEWVSADLTTDTQRGISYYTARIQIPKKERERLGVVSLIPGMPVEAFFETGSRNVLSYFLKPLADQVAHVFREE